MKTMSCKQLGGACEQKFTASTFEEIAKLSEQHGMKMFQAGDKPHLAVMDEMRGLMQNPDAMMKWFDEKRKEFESLAED